MDVELPVWAKGSKRSEIPMNRSFSYVILFVLKATTSHYHGYYHGSFSFELFHRFTQKSGQRIKFTKNPDKYLVPCKSTIEEVSFDWSNHGI